MTRSEAGKLGRTLAVVAPAQVVRVHFK